MSSLPSLIKRSFLLAALSAPVVLVTGCAMTSTATDVSPSSASAVTLSGHIHGGNQPVTGSTVRLYAAGATGYGSASTLYATTTSANDAYGSFGFTKLGTNTGPATPTTNVYGCPATGDPQMYIIAKGGSTQGNGNGTNSAAGFVAALGKCSTISAATFVDLNEVVSVATLAALQQYFNPNTESFGYAATAQSATGFANGVATISNLATISTGVAVATFVPASTVAGVTITGTPENAKLNTIANILAACVNTTSNTSTQCNTLFANAVPPASAAVTSQPAITFPTATDTLQAGYYMMVNPTASQDPTGKMATLLTLSSPTAPFQPTVGQPLDWTLGITYSASGTCTNTAAAPFFSSMESITIDAGGNVWFNNGQSAATGALGQLSPTGAATVCAFGTIPSGRGITVDIAGNIWTTGSNATTSVYEYLANGSTLNWPTANAANGIASDGAGNIFYAPLSTAAPFQEYVAASAATATAASVPVGGSATSSTNYLNVAADPAGRIWTAASNSAVYYDLYPGGTAPTNGYTLVDAGTGSLTTTVSNNAYGTAIDASGNIFSGNTCCAAAASNTLFKITPSTTAGTATGINSPKFLGGVVAPRSTAVDGAGNVWAGMGYPVLNTTQNSVTANVYALAEVDNTLTTALSPAGLGAAGPGTCASSGSNCPTQGGFQKASLGTVRSLAIDPTGNVWAASNGTAQNIVEIVGTAVPVVTPLSVGAKNSTLGTKP